MDINQIARMIEWLDEERRRDKTTIASLEERISQQKETIETLQRRLSGVESDQTLIRETSLGSDKELDLIERMREEMRQLLENTESRRLNAEREQERRAELTRKQMQRDVEDLTERLDKMVKASSGISEIRSESERLASLMATMQQRMDDLGKKLEEPDRRLAFLEEQRRQDARRLSETETEVPEVRKQIESIRPKLQLLEELSLRNERRIQDVQNSEVDRREQIQQFIDSQALLEQQRDRQINELTKQFDEYKTLMDESSQRFETWAQAYREMKRIIDDFERIGDRLERRINEVAEMQRLSEERFRQEWNDWRDDEQRRWKQMTLANDEVWRNHDKEFDQYVKRIDTIEERLPSVADGLERLWKLERGRAQLYREGYQSLLLEFDTTSGSKGDNDSDSKENGVT